MYHTHTSMIRVDIYAWWISTNVSLVKVARPWYNVQCCVQWLVECGGVYLDLWRLGGFVLSHISSLCDLCVLSHISSLCDLFILSHISSLPRDQVLWSAGLEAWRKLWNVSKIYISFIFHIHHILISLPALGILLLLGVKLTFGEREGAMTGDGFKGQDWVVFRLKLGFSGSILWGSIGTLTIERQTRAVAELGQGQELEVSSNNWLKTSSTSKVQLAHRPHAVAPWACIPFLTGCSVQMCKVYNVQCTVYRLQCTVYSVQCKVYSVQCIVYSVQCTV